MKKSVLKRSRLEVKRLKSYAKTRLRQPFVYYYYVNLFLSLAARERNLMQCEHHPVIRGKERYKYISVSHNQHNDNARRVLDMCPALM